MDILRDASVFARPAVSESTRLQDDSSLHCVVCLHLSMNSKC